MQILQIISSITREEILYFTLAIQTQNLEVGDSLAEVILAYKTLLQ